MGLRKGEKAIRVDRRAKVTYAQFKKELEAITEEPVSTIQGQISTGITDTTGVLAPDLETEDSVCEDFW